MLYYDGSHLRLVAWRTPKARLLGHEHADDVDPEPRLIAIAGSLRRLKS